MEGAGSTREEERAAAAGGEEGRRLGGEVAAGGSGRLRGRAHRPAGTTASTANTRAGGLGLRRSLLALHLQLLPLDRIDGGLVAVPDDAIRLLKKKERQKSLCTTFIKFAVEDK